MNWAMVGSYHLNCLNPHVILKCHSSKEVTRLMQRFLVNDIPQMDFYRTSDKMFISLSFSLQSIDPQNRFFIIKWTFCVRDCGFFFSENCTKTDT